MLEVPGLAARAIEGICERRELLRAQISQRLSERRDVDDDRALPFVKARVDGAACNRGIDL